MYPDVLNAITGYRSYVVDVLQVALSVSPPVVPAGQACDAVVILQNTINLEVDAILKVVPPERDLVGNPGQMQAKMERPLRIGLRPGEVGVAWLPVLIGRQTTPANEYSLHLEIYVEFKGREVTVLRNADSQVFNLDEFDEERRAMVSELQRLNYTFEAVSKPAGLRATLTGASKTLLAVPFEVRPPDGKEIPLGDLKSRYTTLWSEPDRNLANRMVDEAQPQLSEVLVRFNRNTCYFPLLLQVQYAADQARYRLWAGEAVMIAKLLTLVLEMGTPQPLPGQTHVDVPRWIMRLVRMFRDEPDQLKRLSTEKLIRQVLFADLLFDAAAYGYRILRVVARDSAGDSFGSSQSVGRLVAILSGAGSSLNFVNAYVPLAMAGLALCPRLSMPNEDLAESVQLFKRAFEKRSAEKTPENEVFFKITDDLIRRALGALNKTPPLSSAFQ
jgi:hypothetical protein